MTRISINPESIGPSVEMAIANFLNGFNCAQSVLLAMSGALGLSAEVSPSIATGFSAGIGRKDFVCGAISGAVMAIGLARGRGGPNDTEGMEETYALSLLVHRKFVERFGTPFCKELIQEELATWEAKKKAFEERLKEQKCIEYVAYATQIGLELLATDTLTAEQVFMALDG